MKRGEFIKVISGGVVLMATGRRALAANPKGAKRRRALRFGILTDTHYSDREVGGTRHYRDSLQKMQEAIDEFNRANVDFIIELGDMKDMPKSADPAKTLADLDRIEAIFQQFDGATYHVLGNHDMDCISKEEFLAHTTNTGRAKGKSYYSFAARGVRCIVLDANFNAGLSPYCRGNFDWTSAQIPPQQLEWLEAELKAHTGEPTLIFLHQLLDYFSGVNKNVCVSNAADIVAILESHPQVLAVFQGHHHPGHYSHRNGIHYITLSGMIEKAAPEHNSFAIVELSTAGNITLTGYHDCPSRKL